MATSKQTPLLLDTHIWLRHLGVSGELKPAAVARIDAAASLGRLFVSVISVWEVAFLVRQNRISLRPDLKTWVRESFAVPGLRMLPLTAEIAIESVGLPAPMHKDPADRILVASARVEQMTLVTRDREILNFAAATKLAVLEG